MSDAPAGPTTPKYIVYEVKGSTVRFWRRFERLMPGVVTWARPATDAEAVLMDKYFVSRCAPPIGDHDTLLEMIKEN